MATSALIPVSEYLSTMYRPDCDYVDGEVLERNVGEEGHSDVQGRIFLLLTAPEHRVHIRANPEIRIQVSELRFRVPDICVRRADAPSERIIRHAPLLCIEVLSPSDTIRGMRDRIRDYLAMGVPEVWLLDPETRSAMIYSGATMVEQTQGELKMPGTPVALSLAEIFKVLDEYQQ